jgi:hypothetical protein
MAYPFFGAAPIQRQLRLVLFAGLFLFGREVPLGAAPKLASVFPLGGEQGASCEVDVKGTGLEGSYAVWLGRESQFTVCASEAEVRHTRSDGIEAHIAAVPDGSAAKLRLAIAADARIGFHELAVISPAGLSPPIAFWVGPPSVIDETDALHDSADTAQPLAAPIAVNGRLAKSGQFDFYTFASDREQTLAFEIVALNGANFEPQLALYEAEGSFLDPRRSRRLLFHEELTLGGMPASRRMTFRCADQRYTLQIGNVFGHGGDFSYLLRISSLADVAANQDAVVWANQRLEQLHSRSISPSPIEISQVQEVEPNDQVHDAQTCTVPVVLSGAIGQAGDVDYFKFNLAAGTQLALDAQTPNVCPPHFNLRLDLLDAKGTVQLSNLQERDVKIGTVDAKGVGFVTVPMVTLGEAGEYVLRVRDLTSIQGSPDHTYRVLVRPQMPHVGEIKWEPAGPLNLVPGATQQLTVATTPSEGFSGSVTYSVEGLPRGVQAFVGASAIALRADATAPLTETPHVLHVWGLLVADGKSGLPFAVKDCPLMIVKQ